MSKRCHDQRCVSFSRRRFDMGSDTCFFWRRLVAGSAHASDRHGTLLCGPGRGRWLLNQPKHTCRLDQSDHRWHRPAHGGQFRPHLD